MKFCGVEEANETTLRDDSFDERGDNHRDCEERELEEGEERDRWEDDVRSQGGLAGVGVDGEGSEGDEDGSGNEDESREGLRSRKRSDQRVFFLDASFSVKQMEDMELTFTIPIWRITLSSSSFRTFRTRSEKACSQA